MVKLSLIKSSVQLLGFLMLEIGPIFSQNVVISDLLSNNFSGELSMGMTADSLWKLYPDLLQQSEKAKSGQEMTSLTHIVDQYKIHVFKVIDNKVRSFQSFDGKSSDKYLFGSDYSNSRLEREGFSIQDIQSLRITREQVIYIQPAVILNSERSNENVAFAFGNNEKNIIIFDKNFFSSGDFFVSPDGKKNLEEHIRFIRQKDGTLAEWIKANEAFNAEAIARNSISLFRVDSRIRNDLSNQEVKDNNLSQKNVVASDHTGDKNFYQWATNSHIIYFGLVFIFAIGVIYFLRHFKEPKSRM